MDGEGSCVVVGFTQVVYNCYDYDYDEEEAGLLAATDQEQEADQETQKHYKKEQKQIVM